MIDSQKDPNNNNNNGNRSTGPRTGEGKARSSQNARRSGWFARDLRVAEGKEQLYLEFEEAWRAELQPDGLLELEAFQDFLRACWHKREIIEAQNKLTASSPDAFLDEKLARELDRLHRYERDFERRSARALRELRKLQTARALLLSAAPPPSPEDAASPAAPLADPRLTLQKRTPPPAPFASLPEHIQVNLAVMEVETNHWNARLRARKAGLLTVDAES